MPRERQRPNGRRSGGRSAPERTQRSQRTEGRSSGRARPTGRSERSERSREPAREHTQRRSGGRAERSSTRTSPSRERSSTRTRGGRDGGNARTTRGSTRQTTGSRSQSRHSVLIRGDEGRSRVADEIEKARERRANVGKREPFRFWMPPGTERDYIILDEHPEVFIYEHDMQNPQTGKWTDHLVCVGDFASCPKCEEGRYPSYRMALSIIDLQGFETGKRIWVPFSRKLLMVPEAQQNFFLRQHDREGTLRGALFHVYRDTDKDPNIGKDGELIEFVSEEELMGDYVNVWTDGKGKEHTENCGEPFNYEEIFKEPTADELRRLAAKIDPDRPGSRRQSRAALEDDDFEEEEEYEGEDWEYEEEGAEEEEFDDDDVPF